MTSVAAFRPASLIKANPEDTPEGAILLKCAQWATYWFGEPTVVEWLLAGSESGSYQVVRLCGERVASDASLVYNFVLPCLKTNLYMAGHAHDVTTKFPPPNVN